MNFFLSILIPRGEFLVSFKKRFKNLILSYDSAPNYKAINLVMAMSSQGLSYKCIIFLLDGFESINWFGRQEIIKMLYASVTRATYELMLVSLVENKYSRKAADVVGVLNSNTI